MNATTFGLGGELPLELSVDPVYPGRYELYSGRTLGMTDGGTAYSYGKGRAYMVHHLRFDDMPSSDYDGGFDYPAGAQSAGTQSLVNWFTNVAPPGSGTFTYIDPFGGAHEVEFADGRLDFSLTARGLYSGTVRLREYIGQP